MKEDGHEMSTMRRVSGRGVGARSRDMVPGRPLLELWVAAGRSPSADSDTRGAATLDQSATPQSQPENETHADRTRRTVGLEDAPRTGPVATPVAHAVSALRDRLCTYSSPSDGGHGGVPLAGRE